MTAAALADHVAVARVLIAAGADVDLQDADRNNPLLRHRRDGLAWRCCARSCGGSRTSVRPTVTAAWPSSRRATAATSSWCGRCSETEDRRRPRQPPRLDRAPRGRDPRRRRRGHHLEIVRLLARRRRRSRRSPTATGSPRSSMRASAATTRSSRCSRLRGGPRRLGVVADAGREDLLEPCALGGAWAPDP